MTTTSRKPLFLDRDGVINHDLIPYVTTADELEIFPWVIDALQMLWEAGYQFFIISNQQGVGKGFIKEEELQKQTKKIEDYLATRGLRIEKYYYCRSLAEANDPWRKPGCGMIEAARDEFGVDPHGAFMIGDRWSDMEAGARAGCRPLLVLSGGTTAGWEDWKFPPEEVFANLLEAAKWICQQKGS
jgi:D-glycero-D-manno-heptose 1,7-bisphosphate phosphatase